MRKFLGSPAALFLLVACSEGARSPSEPPPASSDLAVTAAASAWITKAPMLTPRHSFAAASLNGKLYAIGGNGNVCRSVERRSLQSSDEYVEHGGAFATSDKPLGWRSITKWASVCSGRGRGAGDTTKGALRLRPGFEFVVNKAGHADLERVWGDRRYRRSAVRPDYLHWNPREERKATAPLHSQYGSVGRACSGPPYSRISSCWSDSWETLRRRWLRWDEPAGHVA